MSTLNGSKISIYALAAIFFGIFCFGIVSAVMVSSPDVVKPGDPVSVYVGNLNAGDPVSVLITGNVKTDAGSFFSFGVHDLQLGLAINSPKLHVNMGGLDPNSKVNLTISRLGGIEKVYPPESVGVNGVCDFTETETALPKDTYNIDINGTANLTQIPVTFEISGANVQAETLAECNFNIVGFSNGVFEVTTTVSNKLVEKKKFTVQDQLIAL